jgi:hypothetical protein
LTSFATDAAVGPVAAAVNTVTGAGTETLELGIGASGSIGSTIVGVSAESAAAVVVSAKLGADALIFAYGAIFKCP